MSIIETIRSRAVDASAIRSPLQLGEWLVLLGLALVCVGVAQWSPAAALVLAGLELVALGVGLLRIGGPRR